MLKTNSYLFRFSGQKFENKHLEKLFVIDSNLKRRHTSEFERIKNALLKKSIFEDIARENMSKGGKGVTILTSN